MQSSLLASPMDNSTTTAATDKRWMRSSPIDPVARPASPTHYHAAQRSLRGHVMQAPTCCEPAPPGTSHSTPGLAHSLLGGTGRGRVRRVRVRRGRLAHREAGTCALGLLRRRGVLRVCMGRGGAARARASPLLRKHKLRILERQVLRAAGQPPGSCPQDATSAQHIIEFRDRVVSLQGATMPHVLTSLCGTCARAWWKESSSAPCA